MWLLFAIVYTSDSGIAPSIMHCAKCHDTQMKMSMKTWSTTSIIKQSSSVPLIFQRDGKNLPWEQGSRGQHGAHLGPTGPSWARCWTNVSDPDGPHVGPMNFAIWAISIANTKKAIARNSWDTIPCSWYFTNIYAHYRHYFVLMHNTIN